MLIVFESIIWNIWIIIVFYSVINNLWILIMEKDSWILLYYEVQ